MMSTKVNNFSKIQSNTEDPDFREKRNRFIILSFRDIADRDYISARVLFRNGLYEQFQWCGLQALEKYLKAILLFHDQPAKFGHEPSKLLEQVKKLPRFKEAFSETTESSCEFFQHEGNNRYFSKLHQIQGDKLMALDQTVFEIRRLCDDYNFPHQSQKLRDDEQKQLDFVLSDKIWQAMPLLRLKPRGFMEEVLDNKKHETLRKQLIWKNFYFANRRRTTIRRSGFKKWSRPAHHIYPEIHSWVAEHVRLSLEDKNMMKVACK